MSKPADELWTALKAQLGDKAVLLIAGAFFTLLGGAWARSVVVQTAEERVQSVRRQVETVERKQDRYEEDVHEFAKDVRELYRVMPTLGRSDRLERPFPSHDVGEP